MKTALILVALMLVGCACTGCRGGLFGGRQSPDQGNGDIKVYEIHIAPEAKSVVNIGNAGLQSPLYQAPKDGSTPAEGNGATRVTTPTMPASTGTGNAGTAAGETVMLIVNDGNKRTAESDVAAAAQLLAGNTGTQGTQTPAQVQRQGTATPTSTSTATPTVTETPTIAVPVSLAGQGNPVAQAQAAAPGSAPAQTLTPAPAATTAALQAQYDQALTMATALGTGGGANGANTAAQAAAQARLLETERALKGIK